MNTLKDFRKAIGKTVDEMAEEIGVSTIFFYKVEENQRTASKGFIEKLKRKYPIIDTDIFLDTKEKR